MIHGRSPRLVDRVREHCRVKHYSYLTEKAYRDWIRRFILFHRKRHSRDLGESEVESFLTHLAARRNVAPSTQNQALAALLFLYCEILDVELAWLDNVTRASKPTRLTVVLKKNEARAVLTGIEVRPRLVVQLISGSGLRLMEAFRLRIKDVEFLKSV